MVMWRRHYNHKDGVSQVYITRYIWDFKSLYDVVFINGSWSTIMIDWRIIITTGDFNALLSVAL